MISWTKTASHWNFFQYNEGVISITKQRIKTLTFKFSISRDNVNISLVPHTLIASASFNFSSNLWSKSKEKYYIKLKGQVRRCWSCCCHICCLSTTYLTVAATWNTMFTCLTSKARSWASIPRPGNIQSPLMATILWRNLGWSFLTRSKS